MRDRLTVEMGLSSCSRRAMARCLISRRGFTNEHQQAADRNDPGSGPDRLLEAGAGC